MLTWTVVSECSRRASMRKVSTSLCGRSPRAEGTAWKRTVCGPLGIAPVAILTWFGLGLGLGFGLGSALGLGLGLELGLGLGLELGLGLALG